MNGCLIPDTPIVVDFWKKVGKPFSKHYFLSHMHSDHTQGLSASWRWEIYCSTISAKLLIDKFQIKDHLVRPLELNQSHIIPLDPVGKETMTVTLFDANHCPGSVMFLFEGYFGRILYTGDFRYEESTFPTQYLGPEHPIDKLYLDNTFNNPRCCFPSRAECKEKILNILAGYPDHEAVFGMYTLGKEDLLVDIAVTLKTRVVVSPARMRSLQLLEFPDVFTTDKNEGRVRLVPRRIISNKNMARWNEDIPTVAILPTGLFSLLDAQPYANQNNVYVIPYSDHSSYPELHQFVSKVCPRVITPIVKEAIVWNTKPSVTDMHNFDDLLDKTSSTPFVIPSSVVQFMSNDHSGVEPSGESRRHSNNVLPELRNNQRRSSQSAMGVVFQDDEEEQNEETAHIEGLKSKQLSPLETTLSKACQSHTLNSNSCTLESNRYSEGQDVPESSTAPLEITTTEIRRTPSQERYNTCIDSQREPKTTQRMPAFPPEIAKIGAVVTLSHQRKEGCIAINVGRKRPSFEKRKQTECPETDLILSHSMATKKRRVLPEFCSSTPEPGKQVHSGNAAKMPSHVSFGKIEDFFHKINPTRETDSKQRLCELAAGNEVVVGVGANTSKLYSQPTVYQACHKHQTKEGHKHQTKEVHKQKWEQHKEPQCKLLISNLKEKCVSTSKKENAAASKVSRSSSLPITLSRSHICVKPMTQESKGHQNIELGKAFQSFFARKSKSDIIQLR